MKAITIIQPWATLVALGEKKFETRSWGTKYRGPLAIHAGMKVEKELCQLEPFKSVLAKHGYTADNLPTGVVVATCHLKGSFKCIKDNGLSALLTNGSDFEFTVLGNEYAFGWYDRGRFAWELTNVKQVEPIPAKGYLGLWNWDGGTTE